MPQFSDDLFLGSAQTNMGLAKFANTSTVNGTISGTVLTVNYLASGDPITVGMYVSGASVTAGTYITSFNSGVGGAGTYNLSASSTVGSAETITLAGNAYLGDPAPMSVGVGPLGRVYIWDVVPETKQTNNISTAASYSGAGNAVLAAGTGTTAVIRNDGVSVIQLDTPRAVSITIGTGTITNTNVTISGYDVYNQPLTQIIATGTTQSTTVNGTKAFYQISQVAVAGNCGGTIAVGTTDILGCPVRYTDAGYIISAGWANTLAEDTGTPVVADTTNPATSSTGDVRGTYTPSSASNGVRRLVLSLAVPAIAVGPNATRVGALGVNQA